MESDPTRDAVDDLVDTVAARKGAGPARATIPAKAVAYRLRRVAHRLEREMRRELAGHGVELWELEVLAALLRAPGERLTAGELTSEVALTSGTVTHRISRLQERGWVRRDPDPGDRRQVLVSLTGDGRARAHEVLEIKTGVEQDVLGGLGDDVLAVVADALRAAGHRLDERAAR